MKGKLKKWIAVLATVICLSVSLIACNPPAPYVEDGHSVVLDYNDSVSRPRTCYVAKGESLSEPDKPMREGHSITGWFTEKEGGSQVAFPYTPSGDVTFYAHWQAAEYDVTFDYNFSNSVPTVKRVAYGATVSAPAEEEMPEYAGHYFYRWETRPENGNAVVFPYTVRRAATFYAAWLSNETQLFNVTFDGNWAGAQAYEPLQVVQGTSITARDVPVPVRPAHRLAGWATEPDATQPNVTIPYTPSGSVTLYAVWQLETYTVRFRNNYTGADVTYMTETVDGGTEINEPAPPEREGFIFNGWFTSATEGNKIEFPFEVLANTNMYAQWSSVPVTTNIFDAEFTPIIAAEQFPGFSGETNGVGIIQSDPGTLNASSQTYPLLDDNHREHNAYYVIGLYKTGGTLTFNIVSSARVENVPLYISLTTEKVPGGYVITPEGENGYRINVNGTSVPYGSIDLRHAPAGDDYVEPFREFRVGNVTLNQGMNTITLVANNVNVNGTMTARCPMVDYIRLDSGDRAVLSWQPAYDNLYRRA